MTELQWLYNGNDSITEEILEEQILPMKLFFCFCIGMGKNSQQLSRDVNNNNNENDKYLLIETSREQFYIKKTVLSENVVMTRSFVNHNNDYSTK